MSAPRATGPRQARSLAALAAVVTLAHLWLAGQWLPARLGEGAADTLPRRIEVVLSLIHI